VIKDRYPLLRNRGHHFRYELGVPVDLTLLLGRSEFAAMWLGGLVAYSTGFEVSQVGVFRDWSAITNQTATTAPTLVIRFADGLESREVGIPFMPVPNPPPNWGMLRAVQGQWNKSRWFWIWSVRPLPPPGEMTITASFLAAGIPEVTHAIDTEPILESAARAVPLWNKHKQ